MPERARRPTPEPVDEWGPGRLLSMAARLVEQDWNTFLASQGMTHAGLVALHQLAGGPRSQRELAAACVVEEQTMTRIVDKLARSGHVTRVRDPADGRRLLITRTAAGARAWRAVTRADVSTDLVRCADPDALRRLLIEVIAARLAARAQPLPEGLREPAS